MAALGRNRPCPCGSGIKYKKCCLAKDEAAEPRGLAIGQRNRREGPAAQMMRFVQPLLEAAGDDEASIDRAFTLGMAFWNLAACEGETREDMLADLLNAVARDAQDVVDFCALADDMVERHQVMFPEMHRKQVAAEDRDHA